MLKRLVSAAAAAALIALALSGCSPSAPATSSYDSAALGNTPANIMQGGKLAFAGDDVFYCEPARVWNYGGGLFRCQADGTGKQRLAGGDVGCLNAAGDTVFFVRFQKGAKLGDLMSVGTDGSREQKLASGCRAALVSGGKAYFIGTGDLLFSVDLSGGQPSELVSQPVLSYTIDENGSLCYASNDGIWRAEAGAAPEKLAGPAGAFCVSGGMLYTSVWDAASGTNRITTLNLSDNTQTSFSYQGSRVTALSPYLNVLFLVTADGLTRVLPDGTNPVVYTKGHGVQLCVFEDRAFAWSKEKPFAPMDCASPDFDTTDVYADTDSLPEDCKAVFIRNPDELEQATETYALASASGEELTDKYNGKFFQTKGLILALARVRSGSQWTVTGVRFNGVSTMPSESLTLTVDMDAAAPDESGADVGGCLTEVPKACLNFAKAGVQINRVTDSGVSDGQTADGQDDQSTDGTSQQDDGQQDGSQDAVG